MSARVPGRKRCGRGVPGVRRRPGDGVSGGGWRGVEVRRFGTVLRETRRLRLPPTEGVVGVRGGILTQRLWLHASAMRERMGNGRYCSLRSGC